MFNSERETLLETQARQQRRRKHHLLLAAGAVVFGLVVVVSLAATNRQVQTKHVVVSQQGGELLSAQASVGQSAEGRYARAAVAADAGACSTVGRNIMEQQGGSAVDAAIAAMLCVGIYNAHSTGIGGGHFMVIYERPRNSSQKVLAVLDAREVAPLAATHDMYDNASSSTGGLAMGVPGEIKGYYEAWQRFGRVPWKALLEPTIKLCQDGHQVGGELADRISRLPVDQEPSMSPVFTDNGRKLVEGDIVRRPELARTLTTIAEQGEQAFYNGALTSDIIKDIQEAGGIVTEEDLRRYKAVWREPAKLHLHHTNLTLVSLPPPSSGPIVQFLLALMDDYQFVEDTEPMTERILKYHRIIESMKFTYAKRTYVADPDFENMKQLMKDLTLKASRDAIRSQINDTKTNNNIWNYKPGYRTTVDGGTAHLSVIGEGGSAVALTSTINGWFGCMRRGTRTGIIFNNEMDDFSTSDEPNVWGLYPSEANAVEPGKRPASSMCPTIAIDGQGNPRLAIGGAGGIKIPNAVAMVAAQSLWLDPERHTSLSSPLSLARLHHQLLPNTVTHEQGFPQAVLDGLIKKGHKVAVTGELANVQVVRSQCPSQASSGELCIQAASDVRKGGVPDGY